MLLLVLIYGLPCAGVVLIVNWNMSPAVEYLGLQWLVIGLPCAGGGAYCIMNIGLIFWDFLVFLMFLRKFLISLDFV